MCQLSHFATEWASDATFQWHDWWSLGSGDSSRVTQGFWPVSLSFSLLSWQEFNDHFFGDFFLQIFSTHNHFYHDSQKNSLTALSFSQDINILIIWLIIQHTSCDFRQNYQLFIKIWNIHRLIHSVLTDCDLFKGQTFGQLSSIT